MDIKIYALSKDLTLNKVITGSSDQVMSQVAFENLIYTTVAPPDLLPDKWKWTGDKWIKANQPKITIGFTKTNKNLVFNTIKSEYTSQVISYEGDKRL